MKKAQFKRLKHKENDVQWQYRDRRFICLSLKWIRWAKKYMNRATRRREKHDLGGNYEIYDE